MNLLDSDPRADEDVQARLSRICTKLDDVRDFLVRTNIFTPHPFNARASRSPLGGFGLFANAGGLRPGLCVFPPTIWTWTEDTKVIVCLPIE
jgi:hypothetical protein